MRLSHTRLADAILDVCEVPTNEQTRRICFHILTRCSAPPPSLVLSKNYVNNTKNKFKKKNDRDHQSPRQILEELLDKAIKDQGLPLAASNNLKTFLTNGCLPLPADITKALHNLQEATKKVRSENEKSKRTKRYNEIARGIKSIQNLANMLREMRIISPIIDDQSTTKGFLPPSYISLDLGLRKRQQQFQGQLYFQALLLPDNCQEDPALFDKNDNLLSSNPKLAIKIAATILFSSNPDINS